jgi:hypothetical protein
MISKEEAELMQQSRNESLRQAEEAFEVGVSTVEGLAHQEQQLTHSEKNLIHQEYLLAKSRRTLRGMTWSGWVANMFTDEPPPPEEMTNFPSTANYKVQLHQQKYAPKENIVDKPLTSTDPTIAAQFKAQDDYINQQLKNVTKLAEVGNIISSSVQVSSQQVDILDEHVEEINDETRAIIRMQGRLHRSVRGKPVYLYVVVIEHIQSGMLLYVSESGYPELMKYEPPEFVNTLPTPPQTNKSSGTSSGSNNNNNNEFATKRNKSDIPVSARWELFQRPDEVIALKSCATQTYLGQNLLGYIKTRGSSFGNWESFEFDLMKNNGPLLCCSANSNSGGWVHLTQQGASVGGDQGTATAVPLRLEAKSDTLTDKRSAPTWHFHHVPGPTVPIQLNLKHYELMNKKKSGVSTNIPESSRCAFDV